MQIQVVLEGKSLLQLCRVNQVIVFYPKTMNKRQGKNDLEIFHDQIFLKELKMFCSETEKRTISCMYESML